MAQKLIQTQTQKLVQQQRLTQQQMLQIKLLEMPLAELEQNIQAEIDDNPAMETDDADEWTDPSANEEYGEEESTHEESFEQEERQSALDEALQNIGRDDEMPEARFYDKGSSAEYEEMTYGDQVSFYDKLKEQMGEINLTEQQTYVMEYIIGSLDSDGILRKELDAISDELAIYHNVDTTETEVEEVLKMLQGFDPAGIGARSLQECLLIQIDRKKTSSTQALMHKVIADCYDDFKNKHHEKIAQRLGITEDTLENVMEEIVKLNPKPGSSMGETEGRNIQQITPDFIIDTTDDGTVTFSINKGCIPDLYISPAFADMVQEYQNNKGNMNRQTKEALLYAKEKVDRARGYIEAVKQRRHTLYVTMKAIIDWQKNYFQSGDENDLRPMVLKDVAEQTQLDISTISRVSNAKYAQTRWGTFLLRHFFSEGVKTENGEEFSTRKLRLALQEIISKEDKNKPMSDDALSDIMKKKGYAIARRTVAKYREQLGIPSARYRKK